MKKILLGMCCLAALGTTFSTKLLAQEGTDNDTPEVFQPETSPGNDRVAARISEDFSDLADEDTRLLVDALRDGDDLTLEIELERLLVDANGVPILDADGNEQFEIVVEPVTVENQAGALGHGEISIALGLADALLEDGFTRADLLNTFSNADANGILDLRAAGMGWGEIFASFDLRVGEVMRNIKANGRPAAEQALKADKPARSQRPALQGNPAIPEKAGRPENPGKSDRPEKPEKPERPERPEKPERPERPERPEKPEKPERPEKPEKPERPNR